MNILENRNIIWQCLILVISIYSGSLFSQIDEALHLLQLNGKRGVFTASKSVNIEPIYDDIGGCNNVSFCVKNGDYIGIVDVNGNILYPLEYDHIGTFSDSILFLHKGNKMQIVNFYSQKLIRSLEVDEVLDGSYSLSFRNTGTSSIEPEPTVLFYHDWLIVRKNDKFGIMSLSGEILVPAIYDNVATINRRGVLLFIDGKGGFYDEEADGTLKQILPCKYEAIKDKCYLMVRENDLWGVLDYAGKVLISPQFADTELSSFQQACKKIGCNECDMETDRSKLY